MAFCDEISAYERKDTHREGFSPSAVIVTGGKKRPEQNTRSVLLSLLPWFPHQFLELLDLILQSLPLLARAVALIERLPKERCELW